MIIKAKKLINQLKFILSLYKKDKSFFVLISLKMVLDIINPFIIIYFPKKTIDALVEYKNFKLALYWIIAMVVSTLIISFLNLLLSYYINTKNKKLTHNLIRMICEKSMTINYSMIESATYLDTIQNAKTAVEEMTIQKMISAFTDIIIGIFVISGLVFILTKLNIAVVLILMIIVIANAYANAKSRQADYKFSISTKTVSRKTSYIYNLMMDFSYGKEVRLFQLDNFILNKYKKTRDEFYNMRKSLAKPYVGVSMVASIAGFIQRIMLYCYMALQYIGNLITIGDFSMLIAAAEQFTNQLTSIISSITEIGIQHKYIDYLHSYLISESGNNSKHKNNVKQLNKEVSPEIKFENVWFRYPEQENYILSNLSFTIKKDEKIAIVGENGAGKTTMIKLLLRLCKPEKGQILLDGVNINEYDFKEYVKIFSTVFQDYSIFSLTMKDNIIFDSPNGTMSDIDSILSQLGLTRKVADLPNGMDSFMFKNYSADGIELSLGEQQKLALARALYKNGSVLIMDEPTSALSPTAEEQIYIHMSDFAQGKTTIFVSHRLASTKFCDRIFVFKEGKIVEEGSHSELISKSGVYAELFNMQAELYK